MDENEQRARIQQSKEWLARRTARLDQKKKQFEAQYPMVHPDVNLWRLDDLEVRAFSIEINRWELEGKIKGMEDEEL